jgi:hypothetical protein
MKTTKPINIKYMGHDILVGSKYYAHCYIRNGETIVRGLRDGGGGWSKPMSVQLTPVVPGAEPMRCINEDEMNRMILDALGRPEVLMSLMNWYNARIVKEELNKQVS